MFFPDKTTKSRKNAKKDSDEFIDHIILPILSMNSSVCPIDRNINHNGNKVKNIAPDGSMKDLIAKPSEMLYSMEQPTMQSVVINFIQNREVIIISILDSTQIKKDLFHASSSENESHLKIYQLLQYIKTIYQNKEQRLPQQALTEGPKLEIVENDYQISTNISKLHSILDNVTPETTSVCDDKIRTKNTKRHYDVYENLLKPISSDYQMASYFYIYNKLFLEFLKTFALMYCTLTNRLLTRHKKTVALYSHYWHFRNLYQGYIIKCLLKNGKVNVLNCIRNLYFIIITKSTTTTKIDIFFKLRDGIFIVSSENKECRFMQQIILNKDVIDDLDNMSALRKVNDHSNNNKESKSDKKNCGRTSSAFSLPVYPSQSRFLGGNIIKCQQYNYDDPECEAQRLSSDSNFKNSDLKQDLNEMFVNIRCGMQELRESLCDLRRCTNEAVYNQYCCAAGMLNRLDFFNEQLFEITSFDKFFHDVKESPLEYSWQKIGKPLLQTLGKSLAYTLFSSVL